MKYLAIIICLYALHTEAAVSIVQGQFDPITCRPNITFILGQDDSAAPDPYYTLATEYYLSTIDDQTHRVIDTCSSVMSLRNFLSSELPQGAEAWGTIHIVAHGNPWTGLSAPIHPNGVRTTLAGLIESVASGDIAPLPDHMVDDQTTIDIKACGLGSNRDWLSAFQMALGGFDERRPQVISSEQFIQYLRDDQGRIQVRYLTPHYAFYRTAYRPADLHLARQLAERYPNKKIKWLNAMRHKTPSGEGEAFHDRFNVPVEWYVPVDDSATIKLLTSEKAKLDFVKQQRELNQILKDYEIPIEKFRWTMTTECKEEQEYILIKGKSTVLCVLQEQII